MTRFALSAFTIALSTLTACAGNGAGIVASTPASTSVVELDRDFTLAPGQSARVDGAALTVWFTGVPEDSRCAIDVQCVWAGNALVSLTIIDSAGSRTSASLNTTLAPHSAQYAAYEVQLIGVEPVRKQGSAIAQSDYRATLHVRRR